MGDALRRRLLQSRFESPHHEALLNLLVASAWVRERMERVHDPYGITPGQYNLLRILRGARPDGLARCDIAKRLIDRAPDLTRMIDRLERAGLVERARSGADRRQSIACITRKGAELLDRMHPAIQIAHREIAAHLSRADAETLSRLCEQLYAQEEAAR